MPQEKGVVSQNRGVLKPMAILDSRLNSKADPARKVKGILYDFTVDLMYFGESLT